MISHLQGILTKKSAPWVVIDVGGVGYEVEVSLGTFDVLPKINQKVFVYTQMIVREDAQLLYGFSEMEEKIMFQTLIKVNGVGAKMALAILSSLSVAEFSQAITGGNTTQLIRVPGVGKKTAERLVVEMKDRITGFAVNKDSLTNQHNTKELEAIAALEALGYKANDAAKRVRSIIDDIDDDVTEIIRLALKN